MPVTSNFGFEKSFARKLYRKITKVFTLFVCLMLTIQPMMVELAYAQDIIIDPNGNVGFKPSLQRTARPQVVDIAKPNAGGVSHNQYTRFNVTSRGAVLNNSQTATDTQVAGNVAGNPNLTDGTASTIVNEVTSTAKSTLNGAIEVAGDRANVIIANPNGIACNGCNFINASNGTLTTGVPVIDGGSVKLNVTQGAITIGRSGLNGAANGVGNINLIGRTVVINGKVTAIDGINVQGGAQSYDWTKQRRAAALDGTGVAPDFVVDGTEYGAMEAGRIQIIGNEQGLGVRTLGAVQSSADDVRIVGEGDTAVRSVAAQGQAVVQSTYGDLTLERDVTSATANVVAYARDDVHTTDRTGLYGFTGVELTARKGALSFAGDLQSGADVRLYGERKLTFAGYGSAAGKFALDGRREVAIEAATVVADSVTFQDGAGIFRLSNAAIFSAQDVQINAGEFQLGEGVVVDGLTADATSNLVVDATSHFRNSADLRRLDGAAITYAGNLYNELGGIIEDTALTMASTGEVHNAGVLYGTDSIDLNVAQLFNSETGAILSKSVRITTSGLLENSGTITSEGNLTLASDRKIANDGYIQAIRAVLTAPDVKNAGNGELRVRDSGQITASGSFANDGILASLASFKVTTGRFENKGVASVNNVFEVIADTIINQETVTAGERISLRSTGEIKNLGTLASYGRAYLNAGSRVENQGRILADGIAEIRGSWFDNKGEGALLRAKTGRIYSASLRNSGEIYLIDNFTRRDLDLFDNSGVFAAQGAIQLKGRDDSARAYFREGSVLVSGLRAGETQELLTGQSTTISFNALTVDGRLAAGGSLNISGQSKLSITDQLQAGQNLYLTGDSVSVGADAQINAGGTGVLTATKSFTNRGVISLDGVLQLGKNAGSFTNYNLIAASGTSKFTLYGNFLNAGVFQTTGTTSVVAANITNSGHMQTDGHLSLNAQQYEQEAYVDSRGQDATRWVTTQRGSISGTGTISVGAIARLTGRQITLGDDSYLSADLMHVTADRFYNRGAVALAGDGRNEWKIAETLHQYGTTYADGDIRLNAGKLSTYADSLIGSGKRLTFTVANSAVLSGNLSADYITMSAGAIAGSGTSLIVASDDIRMTAQTGLSLQGEIASGDDLVLVSERFDLRGNAFGERVSITGQSRGYTRGNIFATETLDIALDGSLSNYGLLEARDKITTSSGGFSNYAGAKLSSTEIDARSTGSMVNVGEIAAASRVTLKSDGSFTNNTDAKLTAVSFGLTSAGFANRGEIDVYGFFGDVNGSANNYGTITAQTYFGLEAGTLYNRDKARLLSDGHLYVKTTDGGMVNYAGAQVKGETIDLRVGSLSNNGAIEAREVVNVADVAGDIRNSATGTIHGKTIALLSGRGFRNDGVIGRKTGTDIVNISGKTAADNYGQIAGADLRVISDGGIRNYGSLEAVDFLGLKSSASSISNTGVLRGDTIRVEAKVNFLNERLVQAGQEIVVDAGGKITNRDGGSTRSEIKAATVGLIAGDNIDNTGVLLGSDHLGLHSENGRIYNNGKMTSRDIALIARNGAVYSPVAITSGGSLAIEAQHIGLREKVRATDTVSLKTTDNHIVVEKRIETKELFIDAAGDLKAAANVLQGSDRIQIIADDILRTDTDATNVKLGSIYRASGDIYVRLKTGDIGTWGSLDGSGHVYETVNWDVSRSVSLIADKGNILLSGRIQADDDLFVKAAAGNTGIKDIRFDIGDILHLEGRGYLKQDGWWTPASARKVQLVQNYGWFYTDDWLQDTDINYNLTVQANTIVVNSSHRFVNKELYLRATNDITQRDQVISTRKLTYSAGDDILIDFDPFVWRAANPGAEEGTSWWDVTSGGLRGNTLMAQLGGMTLYAGQDLQFKSGKVHTSGDLNLSAGRNITSEPIYKINRRGWENGKNNVPANVGWTFSNKYRDAGNWRPSAGSNVSGRVQGDRGLAETVRSDTRRKIKERRAYVNHLTATQNINIYAGGHATFVGSYLKAHNGDLYIQAGQGINFAAASGYREYAHDWSKKDKNLLRTKYETWAVYQYDDIYTAPEISAKNGKISLVSEGDILSAGTQITARDDLLIASAQRNITLGTYQERYRRIGKYTKKKSTFGGLIDLGGSQIKISVDAKVNTGNDFRTDSQLTLKAENDIRIIGGQYQAKKIVLDAGQNLYIDGAIDSIRLKKFTEKTNFVTITTIQEGFDTESVSLPEIRSTEAPEFNIGGDVHIAGWRGKNLNASLLRTISRREFDNALVNLYTPEDQAQAANAAQDVDRKYLRDYDLPGASDGQQFAYLDTLIQDHGATYHTIQLRDHEWYDKQVRLNPAFQALLTAAVAYASGGTGFGLFGTVGSQSTFQVVASQAFNNFTVSVIDGSITGNFDLGDALGAAIIAGGTSYVAGHINTTLGFDNAIDSIGKAGGLQEYFAPDLIVDRLGNRVVNQTVSNVLNGEDPFEGFDDLGRTFLVTETLAVAQFGIGELGDGNANWEGSVGHLLLHGGVGCVALEALDGNCAAGFFSGASSSLLAGSNLSDAQKLKLAPLVGALTAFPFANGEAVNVSFGGTISQSAILNNYLTHSDQYELKQELERCFEESDGCSTDEQRTIAQVWLEKSIQNDRVLAQTCFDQMCIDAILSSAVSYNEAITEVHAVSPVAASILSNNNAYVVSNSAWQQLSINLDFAKGYQDYSSRRCDGVTAETCMGNYREAYAGYLGDLDTIRDAQLLLALITGGAVLGVEICAASPSLCFGIMVVDAVECAAGDNPAACAPGPQPLVRPTRAGDASVPNATNGGVSAPNLTERGTFTNRYPGDAAVLQSTPRTLVQDSSGRYWLEGPGGNRITPSGSYDFVTMPNGTVRVARPNTNQDYSTHLGLSGGGEVSYAGSIRFGNNAGPNRGTITNWTNNSGHYTPPAELSGNAGLPSGSFTAHQ